MLLFCAALAGGAVAGAATRSMWPMFAVFALSIAIQIKTGRAFPARGQARWFTMWDRDEEPDQFRDSIFVQLAFAGVFGVGASVLMFVE